MDHLYQPPTIQVLEDFTEGHRTNAMLNMLLNVTWLLFTSTPNTCGCLHKIKQVEFPAQVGRGPGDPPTLEELLAANVEEGRVTLL